MSNKMQVIHGLIQGSPEWKKFRQEKLVASESPVIMGASPNMTRDELLTLKRAQRVGREIYLFQRP